MTYRFPWARKTKQGASGYEYLPSTLETCHQETKLLGTAVGLRVSQTASNTTYI